MAGNKKNGISAGNNSIVIGGNVQSSNIVLGNNNTVKNQSINIGQLFKSISHEVDNYPYLGPADKDDIKAELQEIQTALEKPDPDEGFLARRFRNIKRMAPDIVEVAFETLKNPLGGVAEIIKRVAKKMAEDASA
jgi:hypothetical protein